MQFGLRISNRNPWTLKLDNNQEESDSIAAEKSAKRNRSPRSQMSDPYDLPEFDRMNSILDDLMPTKSAAVDGAVAKTVKRTTTGTRRPKKARYRRFAAHTLGQFNDGSNWSNAAGFRSTLIGASAGQLSRLGAVKWGTLSESINWKNALDGPQLVLAGGPSSPDSGPPESVENFFDAMTWE